MTGVMSRTGSPDPATSYSSSTPLTFTLFMSPPGMTPLSRGLVVPPEMRNEGRYGGNPHGYVGCRMIRFRSVRGQREGVMSDGTGSGLVERGHSAAARGD